MANPDTESCFKDMSKGGRNGDAAIVDAVRGIELGALHNGGGVKELLRKRIGM